MTETSTPSVRVSAGTLFLLAAWFGVLTGLGELLVLGYKMLIAGDLAFVSRDVIWMAPLADVLFAALAGVVLLIATGFKPPLIAVAFVFTMVGVTTWGCMFGSVVADEFHFVAMLIVGAGAGKVLSGIIAKKGEGFVRFARGSSKLCIGLLVLLLLGTQGSMWWGTRSAMAALPEAPSAPNVVLITLDTVRAKSLSLHGAKRKTTPKMDAMARGGVVFETAIAPAPWTLPSHATLVTGLFHHCLSVNWDKALDDVPPTIAELLAARGYATAGFVSNLNYTCYEVGMSRGFAHYEDYPISLGQIVLSSALGRTITNTATLRELLGWHENLNRKDADQINGEFLGWLDGQDKERPFFAFLNYYDAHQPYLPPAEFRGKFGGEPVTRTGFRYDTNLIEIHDWDEISKEQKRAEEDAYDEAIAYLDDCLGKLFEALKSRGMWENTLVVITSDHGEQFGEHELYNHGNSIYMQSIHVPLVVHGPGVPSKRFKHAVSLRDVPQTILEAAGVTDTRILGNSLSRHWAEGADPDEFDPFDVMLTECFILEGGKRQGTTQSIIAGDYHFIRNGDEGDSSDELYNIADDIEERFDLTTTTDGVKLAAQYRKLLDWALDNETKLHEAAKKKD